MPEGCLGNTVLTTDVRGAFAPTGIVDAVILPGARFGQCEGWFCFLQSLCGNIISTERSACQTAGRGGGYATDPVGATQLSGKRVRRIAAIRSLALPSP